MHSQKFQKRLVGGSSEFGPDTLRAAAIRDSLIRVDSINYANATEVDPQLLRIITMFFKSFVVLKNVNTIISVRSLFSLFE